MRANARTLQEVEALEDRLQVVKWTISDHSLPQRSQSATAVVSRTAGLLGKRFPAGVTYERRVRQAWAKRLGR